MALSLSRYPYGCTEQLVSTAYPLLYATKFSDESFSMCDPHEALRTSFINLAIRSGCELEAIRAYAGQAPDSVLSGHYADLIPSVKDLPRIRESKILVLQDRVLDKVHKSLIL